MKKLFLAVTLLAAITTNAFAQEQQQSRPTCSTAEKTLSSMKEHGLSPIAIGIRNNSPVLLIVAGADKHYFILSMATLDEEGHKGYCMVSQGDQMVVINDAKMSDLEGKSKETN